MPWGVHSKESMGHKTCPVWVGYLIASPLRLLLQNPDQVLRPYVREGMTVLDVGCAMGFFSLPAARLVGEKGRVICVDMQQKMLTVLEKRARKAGLASRIVPHLCDSDSLKLSAFAADFALAFAIVHEVPDPERLLREIAAALKPHSQLLIAEPRGHVKETQFLTTVALAERCGFRVVDRPEISRSYAVLLEKK